VTSSSNGVDKQPFIVVRRDGILGFGATCSRVRLRWFLVFLQGLLVRGDFQLFRPFSISKTRRIIRNGRAYSHSIELMASRRNHPRKTRRHFATISDLVYLSHRLNTRINGTTPVRDVTVCNATSSRLIKCKMAFSAGSRCERTNSKSG
jgi:hypothetical protein